MPVGEEGIKGVHIEGAGGIGLNADRLRSAFRLLEEWIEEGLFAGAAAIVTRGGQVAGEAYLGHSRRAGDTVGANTVWAVASVTKPFTAAVVLSLVERGLLSLEDRVVDLIPEFRGQDQEQFDRSSIRLSHLLAHCSGLPGFGRENMALRRSQRPLEDFVRSFIKEDLLFIPGALHYYSNIGFLVAAEIAGRTLSGQLGKQVTEPAVGLYHPYLEQAILVPLGMASTSIQPPVDWERRIAWVEGSERSDPYWGTNSAYYRQLGLPWGGLFSCPRDLVRFVDLFLPSMVNGHQTSSGASDDVVLSIASRRRMTSVRFDPPDAPADLAPDLRDALPPSVIRPRVPWGLGWALGAGSHGFFGELNSQAAYGHIGSTGTMVWGDPEFDMGCVLLTNCALASGWAERPSRQAMFSNAVMASVC